MKVKIDSFLEDLIPEYLEGRRKDIQTLQESILGQDLSLIEKITHKMAGNLGSYGFKQLGVKAKEIEESCIEGKEIEKIALLIESFAKDFESLEIEFV